MTTTVRSIITSSLRLLGAYDAAEAPAPELMQAAGYSLTTMLDGWSNDSTIIYNRQPAIFTFVPGQQTYTLGIGGDWDTSIYSQERPMRVEDAFTSYLQNGGAAQTVDIPIEIMNSTQWAHIKVKGTQNPFPLAMYDDGNYPLRTLWFWPVPTTAQNCTLWLWNPIIDFSGLTGLDQAISLPPGYERAIRYNLAIEIAPELGKVCPAEIVEIAKAALYEIKHLNQVTYKMSIDSALGSGLRGSQFNWQTGDTV